jgi:tRNA A37 methylthiotransferase MiaB
MLISLYGKPRVLLGVSLFFITFNLLKLTAMKKYYLWTLGCQMNISDGERIASIFESANVTRTNDESEADFIVTVACSVRQTAVDRIFGKVKKWQGQKKRTAN